VSGHPASSRLRDAVMKSFVRFLKFLLLMLLVLAAFVFSLKNATPVSLWLVREFAPRPVSLWILVAFTSGALLGLLLGHGLWRLVRLAQQLRNLRTELDQCQHDLVAQQSGAVRPGNLP